MIIQLYLENITSFMFYRSIIRYCSLSLSLSTSIGLPPSCCSHRYRYFLFKRMQLFFFFFKSKRMQSFARTSRALLFWCLLCCLRLLPSCSCLLCESIKQANEKHLNAFPAVVAVFFYNNFFYLDYDWIFLDLGLG